MVRICDRCPSSMRKTNLARQRMARSVSGRSAVVETLLRVFDLLHAVFSPARRFLKNNSETRFGMCESCYEHCRNTLAGIILAGGWFFGRDGSTGKA
jgi:hypothetical protein